MYCDRLRGKWHRKLCRHDQFGEAAYGGIVREESA